MQKCYHRCAKVQLAAMAVVVVVVMMMMMMMMIAIIIIIVWPNGQRLLFLLQYVNPPLNRIQAKATANIRKR